MDFSAATTLTATDWRRWIGRNFDVRDGGIVLSAEPSLTVDELPFTAIDLAVDANGDLYTLQPSGAVYRHDEPRGIEQRLWQASDHGVDDPRSLCVADNRLYVIGGDGTLSVISARLQRPIGTIDTGVENPITISSVNDRLYILDAESGSVVTVGPNGTFEPVFESLSSPIDMTLDRQGSIYVLDAQDDYRYAAEDQTIHRTVRKKSPDGSINPGPFPLSTVELEATGESVTPTRIGTATDAPFVLMGRTESDDKTVVIDVDLETGTFHERHRFDEACRVLRTPSVAATDNASYVIVGDYSCLKLTPTEQFVRDQGRNSYVARAYRQFDSGEAAIQWHRLSIEQDRLTASTQVRVSYFASDDPEPLDELSTVTGLSESLLETHGIDTVWDLLAYDPRGLALLSDELTVTDARDCLDTALAAVETATADQWQSTNGPNASEVLLSAATGRYLTVRLELVGSPTTSPRVSSLRATWPRQSYLEYLPEVFQENPESAAFLEQFLSVFGTVFTDIERETETVTQYFDPNGVPAGALPWLSEWIGVDATRNWPTAAIRELLVAAPELYKKRGTKDGLRELILLYLSHIQPPKNTPTELLVPSKRSISGSTIDPTEIEHGLFILEQQALDDIDSVAAKQAYTTHLRGSQSFVVFAGPFAEAAHRDAVADIIEEEKPAHVYSSLIELEPSFELSGNTFLGINSRLSKRQLELGGATLNETAVLE